MPRLRPTLHRVLEHTLNGLRKAQIGPHSAEWYRIAPETSDHHLLLRTSEERQLARQHLVYEQRERVDVRARIECLAAELLGTHELRRPEDDAGRRQLLQLTLGAALLRQPKVHHDRILTAVRIREAANHDVLRLEIAVNDLELVRNMKSFGHVTDEPHGFWKRNLAEPVGAIGEQFTLDVGHHDVDETVLSLAEPHDVAHVRMGEAHSERRLTAQPLHRVHGLGQRRRSHLDSELLLRRDVDRQITR